MSSNSSLAEDYKRRLESSHTTIQQEGLLILYKKLQKYKAHDLNSSKIIDSTQHELQTQLILLMSGKFGPLLSNLSMEIGLNLVLEGHWNWLDMTNRILQVIIGKDPILLESGINYLFKLLNLLINQANQTNFFKNFNNPIINLMQNNEINNNYWANKLIFNKFKVFFKEDEEGKIIEKFFIMENFLNLVLLKGENFEYYQFLVNLIDNSSECGGEYGELIIVYTLNLIQNMNSENFKSVDYLGYLINWYTSNTSDGPNSDILSSTFSDQLKTIIPLHLMNLACKNQYNRKPITEELNLLLDWFKLTGVQYPNETCLMLGYFLFTSNTTQDRSLIFDMLEFGNWFDNIQSNILPTLLLPLLAIVDQSILKSLQLRTKSLLNKLIRRINPNSGSPSGQSKQLSIDQIKLNLTNNQKSHTFIINGPLSQIFYSVQCLQINQLDTNEFTNLNPNLTIIITSALTTHSKGDIQLKALEFYLQCLAQNTDHLLPSISLFVYLLNSKSSPESTPFILYQCFPALVSTSDPFILTKILKLAEKIINMKVGFQINSLTSAVGIRMIYALYTNNNKIWPTLRFIITNWLKIRKSNANRIDEAPSSPTELELAALTTFRELCSSKGGEYGPDLFPLLSSLVQFVPLHPLSLSYVLSCINSIVADDAVEVLAVWKVVISPLIEQFENFQDIHPLIQLEICKFYGELIRKREETESYILLIEDLLHERLRPILFPLENSKISFWVRNEALSALNQFESDKIQSVMFTTPSDLLKSIVETGSSQPNWIPLLSNFVVEEIEGMSRSTFKGQTGVADTSTGSASAERSKKVKESLDTIAESFSSTGLINHPPGLKSAIYLSNMLLFFKNPTDKMRANRDRLLKVAISEVTFGDDLQFRLTHFECWIQFFLVASADPDALLDVNKVEDTPLDLEWTQSAITSLTETIKTSSIPSHVANASAALGALCIALKQSGRDDMADAFGTRVLKTLLQKFETLSSNFIESHADIFYAISSSVSQLISCVPKDFALVQKVIELLAKGMINDLNTPDEWIGYSCGRGLGRVFQSIVSNLIGGQTSEGGSEFTIITSLLNQIVQLFEKSLQFIDTKDISFLMEVGIKLGYTEISMSKFSLSRLYQIDLNCQILNPTEILNSLIVQLESFLDPNAGLLQSLELIHKLTALTVCLPYFAPCLQLLTNDKNHEIQLESQLINLFTKVIQFIEAPQWSQLRGSCNMAFGTFLHIRVSLKGGANSLSKYYSLMNWYLDQLDSNSAKNLSSHQRLANLMGLSSLLGVDPFNYSKIQPFCTSSQCSFNNVKRALSTLQNYSGLTNPQFLDDLKTCRSVVNMTSQLIHSSSLEPREDTLYRRLLITINSNLQISSNNLEPRDYSRFSLSTSYLRSIHESLSQFGGSKEYFQVSLMLLETLDSLSLPLPPVNWFPILSSLAPLCKDKNRTTLLKFVVKNFLKSNSIMEFFLNELDQLQINLPNHNKESLDLLLGMEGLGTVLKLVGFGVLEDRSNLRGGWGAILKLVTVSLRRLEATLIKTCQMMLRKPKFYDALTTCLVTLSNCLQSGISNDVNKAELERVRESWCKLFRESYFNLDIASIDSTYDPLLTLVVGLASYDRVTIDEMISSLGSKSNSQTHIGPILYHLLLINKREGIKSTLKVFSYVLEEGVTTVSLIEWLLKCLAMDLEFQTVISLLNLIILATSNSLDKLTIVARGITYLIGIFQRRLTKNPSSTTFNSIVTQEEFIKLTTILFKIRVNFEQFNLSMLGNRLKILKDSLNLSEDHNNEDDSTLLILVIWQKILNF